MTLHNFFNNYKAFFKIRQPQPEGAKIFVNEKSASSLINIEGHLNENTLITTNHQLIRVIKLGGFSFETADDLDLDIKKELRNGLFKGVSDSKAKFYSHIIRKKKNPYPEGYISSDMPYGFPAYLDKVWVE